MIIIPSNVSASVSPVTVRAAARLAMPTHQAGDLLLGFAYAQGSQGVQPLPSGWTSIHSLDSNTYGTGVGAIGTPGAWYGTRIAYKIAASSSEDVSSAWSGLDWSVVSMFSAASIGGTQTKGGGLVNGYSSFSTPAVTLTGGGPSALFSYLNGYTGAALTTSVPSGWTELMTNNSGGFFSNILVKTSASSGASVTVGTSTLPNGWSVSCCAAVEVK